VDPVLSICIIELCVYNDPWSVFATSWEDYAKTLKRKKEEKKQKRYMMELWILFQHQMSSSNEATLNSVQRL
jgi:hypothetical protein